MHGVTKRQREIIDFIEEYTKANRYAPTYRELREHFGFSSLGSVYNHIRSLKRKGLISNSTKGARSLNLQRNETGELIEIPLIGKIRGGLPIELFPQIASYSLPSNFLPKEKECYLLQVEGNNLTEEMICSGDLLVIEPRYPSQGDMAIALVNDHTTCLKRFFSEPPYIRLESMTAEVRPLILREDHVLFQGVVVGLFRRF